MPIKPGILLASVEALVERSESDPLGTVLVSVEIETRLPGVD